MQGAWSLVTDQMLMVPKGRGLTAGWKRSIEAGALDRLGPKEKPWIALTVEISPDGLVAAVTEPFPNACATALQTAKQMQAEWSNNPEAETLTPHPPREPEAISNTDWTRFNKFAEASAPTSGRTAVFGANRKAHPPLQAPPRPNWS